MLVMTTIFTSKIAELPPTSDTKMLDIWLMFSLLVPFSAVLIQTAVQTYTTYELGAQVGPKPEEAWVERHDEPAEEIHAKTILKRLHWVGECLPHTLHLTFNFLRETFARLCDLWPEFSLYYHIGRLLPGAILDVASSSGLNWK
jgi:hypothetical protein